MDTVIERLKEEKKEDERIYYQKGKVEGRRWAMTASYRELQYALTWETMEEMRDYVIAWNPTDSEVLGDYFAGIMEEDAQIGWEERRPGSVIPNIYFRWWEQGWKDGVTGLWGEIRSKL